MQPYSLITPPISKKVIAHSPEDQNYRAEVILDSMAPSGARLITMVLTFPRIILAEFNTHRQFSRNSASSRAIPTTKIIDMVKYNPFIPHRFPINAKGMQPEKYVYPHEDEYKEAKNHWLLARDLAIEQVKILDDINIHKQIANRLLEPWLWHTVIVSSTEWHNFFHLRTHHTAQDQIRLIANCAKEVYYTSHPYKAQEGYWHLPFLQQDEYERIMTGSVTHEEWGVDFRYVSAARCARVSYLTHDGKRSLQSDKDLAKRLLHPDPDDPDSPIHASPFEHVAMALGEKDYYVSSGNFFGFQQMRKELPNECFKRFFRQFL